METLRGLKSGHSTHAPSWVVSEPENGSSDAVFVSFFVFPSVEEDRLFLSLSLSPSSLLLPSSVSLALLAC